jgi:hypothetical protein
MMNWIRIAALCLAAIPACAQTGIDTAFARKLYSAGHDDLFHVDVSLKNKAASQSNDSVIDTAKTDAFFLRHEILASSDRKSVLSRPPAYARSYEVYISPTEVLFFMEDSLVERLVDLDAAKPTSIGNGRPHAHRKGDFPDRPMGQWLLGRKTGPRPSL